MTPISSWSSQIEEELTQIIKDWLKYQGKTQADLRQSLQAESSRMQALMEVLKKEYSSGGLPKMTEKICQIEESWSIKSQTKNATGDIKETGIDDPFGQLDLLIEEIREDCPR